MKIYNTLTNKIEELNTQNVNVVKMYVCGITPYDETHLGHGRCYVVFDVLRRYLKHKGYNINFVQNFTDIDDKIIEKTKQENLTIQDLTNKYIQSYFKVEEKLNIQPASVYPKVSDHIQDIIISVESLLNKGIAYITETGVYFSIEKFTSYGKLSKRNLSELITGFRKQLDETKKSPLDFALWKFAKSIHEPQWNTPWGKGRPGWHIECSVMSMKYLGETLDIHGGGVDLIFPHHENEIAQSEALTGKQFVKYWVHNGFVTVNKEKMSKSLKNIFALKDLFEIYNPMVIRLFLISQHYQKPLDFSLEEIAQFVAVIEKFYNALLKIEEKLKNTKLGFLSEKLKTEVDKIFNDFEIYMEDNLNTSSAISSLHKIVSLINTLDTQNYEDLMYIYQKFLSMLNILGINIETHEEIPQQVKELVLQREIARKNKNFKKSDELREIIYKMGYVIEDTKFGPRVKPKK